MRSTMRSIIICFLISVSGLRAMDAHVGLRLTNTQWNNDWLITPAPELGLVWNHFQLSVDGTYGLFQPDDPAINHSTITRTSLMPMLRLKLFGPFFLSSGVGISHNFRRDEIILPDGSFDTVSKNNTFSEFRVQFGPQFNINQSLSMYIRGEYSLITNDIRAFAFSFGFSSNMQPRQKFAVKPYSIPEQKPAVQQAPVSSTPENNLQLLKSKTLLEAIQSFSFVNSKDDIINELNTTLESTLIASGYKVISWERVQKTAVNEMITNNLSTESEEKLSYDVKLMKPFDVAQLAYKSLKLHAFIETSMRYEYQSFGGDILVHSAYARVILPATGEILWASEYNLPESSFLKCKQQISEDLLNALNKNRQTKKSRR